MKKLLEKKLKGAVGREPFQNSLLQAWNKHTLPNKGELKGKMSVQLRSRVELLKGIPVKAQVMFKRGNRILNVTNCMEKNDMAGQKGF